MSSESKKLPFIGPCMCSCVTSLWEDDEYPFVRQGVMHSPVGCLRKEYQFWELKALYRRLTGFNFGNDNIRSLFQAVMGWIAVHPELHNDRRIVGNFPPVLTPVSTHPATEISPPVHGTGETRTSVRGASKYTPAKRVDVVVNQGPIKPPWVK